MTQRQLKCYHAVKQLYYKLGRPVAPEEVAKVLGISLTSSRHTLRRMVTRGLLASMKSGRAYRYLPLPPTRK